MYPEAHGVPQPIFLGLLLPECVNAAREAASARGWAQEFCVLRGLRIWHDGRWRSHRRWGLTDRIPRLRPRPCLPVVRVFDARAAVGRRMPVLPFILPEQVVGAVTLGRVQRFDQLIAEDVDVARDFPHPSRQDDRGVESDDVVSALHHELPPLALDVFLQLHAEGPIVPRRPLTAVNLTRLENEPAALCQRNDGVE